jgi:hypothetical protein
VVVVGQREVVVLGHPGSSRLERMVFRSAYPVGRR